MSRLKTILPFLATVLVFLYIANFVVYEAISLALGISYAYWLMLILGVLAVSFIASIFIGMKWYNFCTRAYAAISMAWMGFFAYFFLASFLYILECALIGPSQLGAIILFGGAIVTGVYGLLHACNLVVKEITIEIKNLPEVWQAKKAVFISDLHVGQIHGKRYVERVVRKLKTISPDIVFIGGDLFDGSSASGILESILPFKNLSVPLGIYFVMGNHEGYGGSDIFQAKIIEAGITVVRDRKVIVEGMQIIGVDYTTTAWKENFKNVLAKIGVDRNMPSILIKHEPRFIDVAEDAGISLQLSGHTHKAQQWPFEYFARMAYGKFTYGLQRQGNIQVFTSSGVGTWGPPLRVGTDCEIVVFRLV